MQAGTLNQRVTFDRPVVTRELDGEEIVSWQVVAEVWADVQPLRGAERLAAIETEAGEVTIRCRWATQLNALTRECRARHQGNVYEVTDLPGIKNKIGTEVIFYAKLGPTVG